MKSFLLSVLFVLALMPAFVAGQQMTADPSYGVLHRAQERVALPQDQGRWYVTIFGDEYDSRFTTLRYWFQNDPSLLHLRSQVHYNEYPVSSDRYQQRYAQSVRGLPCVRVQDHRGIVRSEYAESEIPLSANALYNGIKTDLLNPQWFEARRMRPCPGPGPCPRPEPSPRPYPQPSPQPYPQPHPQPFPPDGTPPDLGPVSPLPGPAPMDPLPMDLPPPWLMGLSFMAGALAGIATKWKETYFSDQPRK
jgi:hypothetical protein